MMHTTETKVSTGKAAHGKKFWGSPGRKAIIDYHAAVLICLKQHGIKGPPCDDVRKILVRAESHLDRECW